MSAETMAGTHIDCCISNCAQVEIIPNVNKSADAQPDYRVMTYVIKTSVDQIKMAATSDKKYVNLAFAALSSAQNTCINPRSVGQLSTSD